MMEHNKTETYIYEFITIVNHILNKLYQLPSTDHQRLKDVSNFAGQRIPICRA